MRFIIAIVAFVVAAIMIGVGFGQRTLWAPPKTAGASATVPADARYVLIDGSTLNAQPGQQTLRVSGSADPFVAYGRTADVVAWLGSSPYVTLGFAPNSSELTVTQTSPATGATAAGSSSASSASSSSANPAGSDLWLQEFSGSAAADTRLSVPDGVSVIIASNGSAPAPSRISISWPRDSATPWSGPLIVGGGVLLLVGLIIYIFSLAGMRRGRGPRRGGKPPRMPRPPKGRRIREVTAPGPETHGRRAIGRGYLVAPIVAGALLLSGCSADYWPQFGASTPSLSASASAPIATQLPGQGTAGSPLPAVTAPQLQEIVDKIGSVAAKADRFSDKGLAAIRFTGAAYQARMVDYAIRKKFPQYSTLEPIPTSVALGLPEATSTWPRYVSVVVQDKANTQSAPIDLVLQQQTPRANYQVAYAITIEAGAKVPDLAPANIGAPIVPPTSKLLLTPPASLAGVYSSYLAKGAASPSAKSFDTAVDQLAPQIGATFKQKQIAQVKKRGTSALTFTDAPCSFPPISFATNDSGALVATCVDETAAQKATEAGAIVGVTPLRGATAALTGKTSSSTGFETTYSYQLLFYVPPAGSKETIRLLGFAQAAVAAKELK